MTEHEHGMLCRGCAASLDAKCIECGVSLVDRRILSASEYSRTYGAVLTVGDRAANALGRATAAIPEPRELLEARTAAAAAKAALGVERDRVVNAKRARHAKIAGRPWTAAVVLADADLDVGYKDAERLADRARRRLRELEADLATARRDYWLNDNGSAIARVKAAAAAIVSGGNGR